MMAFLFFRNVTGDPPHRLPLPLPCCPSTLLAKRKFNHFVRISGDFLHLWLRFRCRARSIREEEKCLLLFVVVVCRRRLSPNLRSLSFLSVTGFCCLFAESESEEGGGN
jgi:hypothetical protein